MFGQDRFGVSEDFSLHYSAHGGQLTRSTINRLVRNIYEYLSEKYPDELYRHDFPSVEQALASVSDETYEDEETQRIVDTFAYHEFGEVPLAYVEALGTLSQRFVLGAVIDIWSPKAAWLDTFERSGIGSLFDAISFSSDHGMVKPSPKPFDLVLGQLNITNLEAIVVGDSSRRDLGGAKNAGIDCILVGGAVHRDALEHFSNLVELSEQIRLRK